MKRRRLRREREPAGELTGEQFLILDWTDGGGRGPLPEGKRLEVCYLIAIGRLESLHAEAALARGMTPGLLLTERGRADLEAWRARIREARAASAAKP